MVYNSYIEVWFVFFVFFILVLLLFGGGGGVVVVVMLYIQLMCTPRNKHLDSNIVSGNVCFCFWF